MDILIASAIWVSVGSSVSALAIDPTELFPNRDTLVIEAQCPDNCQADFPVPRDRKYAHANHDAGATEPHGIDGRILVAESKRQEFSDSGP